MLNMAKAAIYIKCVYSNRASNALKNCHTFKTKCQIKALGMYFDSLIADNRKKIGFRNSKIRKKKGDYNI